MNLKDYISEYQDFPKKGVLFRDFSPILREPAAVSYIADEFQRRFNTGDLDVFAGVESRGFILSSILAQRYGKPMIMIRKAGKIPGMTLSTSYDTEYGTDTMELRQGVLDRGQRVVVCDDLLATGGTAEAAARLVEDAGGLVVGFAFIIELTGLGGTSVLDRYRCESLVKY